MYDIWRMMAINDLQSLNANEEALVNIPQRIAELEAQATSIRSATADGTPAKGGGSGREEMLLNNICERDLLKATLEQTRKDVERVKRSLGVLTDTERRILQIRFIDCEPGAVSRLSCELNLDERTIRNRQSDALKKFSKAMRGI